MSVMRLIWYLNVTGKGFCHHTIFAFFDYAKQTVFENMLIIGAFKNSRIESYSSIRRKSNLLLISIRVHT